MGRNRTERRRRWLCGLLFVGYLVLLFYFLFFAEAMGRTSVKREYHYNLVPFKEIMRFLNHVDKLGIKAVALNIVGNVVAFMPFGFLIPMILRRRCAFWGTLFLSLDLSLLVETLQLIFKIGSFDVDDLILNTLGGVLGYVCYRILVLCKRKWAQERNRNVQKT